MSKFDAQPLRTIEMRAASSGMNLNDSVYERLLRERIIFLGQPVDDTIAIFDTMQFVDCDVATYVMGLAASMG